MADITLDQTPVKISIADSAIVAIAEGDKLKNITKGNLFTPLLAAINQKASNTALTDGLALKINISDRGQPNGIGTLNSSGKQIAGQISDLVERVENKVNQIVGAGNDKEYPTTKAVTEAVLIGVNAAYNGTASLDIDGESVAMAAIKSFWFVVSPGTYTNLGGVTLALGYFGIVSKIGADSFTIASIRLPLDNSNFETKYGSVSLDGKTVTDGRIIDKKVTWVMVGDFTKRTGFEFDNEAGTLTFTDDTEIGEFDTIIINIETP